METGTQLSSLFHKYINFMMTTDDRYLMEGVVQPYEVCGYWRDKETRDLKSINGEDMTPETREALIHHWQHKMKPELPIAVLRCNGWLVICLFTPESDVPNMATAVMTEDWCAIVEEAARLGLYVKPKSSSKAKDVPFERLKKKLSTIR